MTEAAAELGTDPQVVRVLLCDDDPVMREALMDLVGDSEGFEVVGVATDADSAASMAEALTPDVVLLDVRMPGGGGPRAAQLIRRRVQNARLIAFSAHHDRHTVLGMLRAGASEYLVKGVDGDTDILDAMRRTDHGHFGLSPGETEELVRDVVNLLTVTEARLGAANANLLRLGGSAKAAAEDAVTQMEAALEQLAEGSRPDGGAVREALQLALGSQRHVIDCLSAANVVATAHARTAESG